MVHIGSLVLAGDWLSMRPSVLETIVPWPVKLEKSVKYIDRVRLNHQT